eukprot:331800_1
MEQCQLSSPTVDNIIVYIIVISVCALLHIGALVHYIFNTIKIEKADRMKPHLTILFGVSQIAAIILNSVSLIQTIGTISHPSLFENVFFCGFTAFQDRIILTLYYVFMIDFLLLRFKTAFIGSVYAVSNPMFYTIFLGFNVPILCFWIVGMSMLQKPCLNYWKNNPSYIWCLDELHGLKIFLIMFGFILLIFYNIIVTILFISKLHNAAKMNESVVSIALRDLMIKQTISCFIMVISTLFSWAIWFVVGFGVFIHIDVLLNCFILMLSLGYNAKYYNKLCHGIHKCCSSMFTNPVIKKMMSHSNSNNNSVKINSSPKVSKNIVELNRHE